MTTSPTALDQVELVELVVGEVAHGGHCVARTSGGQVVFVRHALPGERVLVEVTEERRGYLRADTVRVLVPSPDRVAPPCRYAGECGGCDFQHANLAAQRELKARVVREQLLRLGRLSPVAVDGLGVRVLPVPVPGRPDDGLGWRTRVRFAVDAAGRAGLLAHRSHQVVPVGRCAIADPGISALELTGREWPRDDQVDAVASDPPAGPGGGNQTAGPGGGDPPAGAEVAQVAEVTVWGDASGLLAGPDLVRHTVLGRDFTVPPRAFWQVHPGAAEALTRAVLELLAPVPGERAWDLYGGAGLFAAALAVRVGPGGEVVLVESEQAALAGARASLADLPQVRVVGGRVERVRLDGRPDLVVLDPPRSGAGAPVVARIAASGARAVACVACDPAAFARDVAGFAGHGWRLTELRCFDTFPMTHHVECVGLFVPA